MAYTTANLLTSISRRSMAPEGQNTYNTDDILEMADEETRGVVNPSIMRLREDYFVTYSDISIVANQGAYAIPARAAGLIVRDLHLVSSGNSVTRLTKTEIERVGSYGIGHPSGFYFRGNKIVLTPTPSSAESTLRVYYSLAPAKLVETSSTAVIAAIDTAALTVTVLAIPSSWSTGSIFDLSKQDGGQEPLATDLTSTDVASNVITLPSLPSDLRIGDYVSLAGETSLLQMPAEYRDVLAQAVAVRMLADMSQAGAERAENKLKSLLDAAEMQFKPRSVGESEVILNSHWY